jgi:4-alpha-glucanotransferase
MRAALVVRCGRSNDHMRFYVHHNSADVWHHPDQFRLGDSGQMIVPSGVPPDGLSGELAWSLRRLRVHYR